MDHFQGRHGASVNVAGDEIGLLKEDSAAFVGLHGIYDHNKLRPFADGNPHTAVKETIVTAKLPLNLGPDSQPTGDAHQQSDSGERAGHK